MNNIKCQNIIACGDIHGEFRNLGFILKNKNIEHSVILLCGDIGMGFYKKGYYINEFKRLNKKCIESNNIIIGVRGNHDDPFYFDNKFIFSNIMLVEDYSLININDKNILFIGGGISVDRLQRIGHGGYWKDEIPYYDEKKLKNIKKPDIIISHSSPSFCEPKTKVGIQSFLYYDKKLEKDCNYERGVFTNVFKFLEENNKKPECWCYGHFHMSNFDVIYDTKFKALDIMELYDIR